MFLVATSFEFGDSDRQLSAWSEDTLDKLAMQQVIDDDALIFDPSEYEGVEPLCEVHCSRISTSQWTPREPTSNAARAALQVAMSRLTLPLLRGSRSELKTAIPCLVAEIQRRLGWRIGTSQVDLLRSSLTAEVRQEILTSFGRLVESAKLSTRLEPLATAERRIVDGLLAEVLAWEQNGWVRESDALPVMRALVASLAFVRSEVDYLLLLGSHDIEQAP